MSTHKPHDSFGTFLKAGQRENTLIASTVNTVIKLPVAIPADENIDKVKAVMKAFLANGLVSHIISFEDTVRENHRTGFVFNEEHVDEWLSNRASGTALHVPDYQKELMVNGQDYSVERDAHVVHISILLYPSHWEQGEDFVTNTLQSAFSEVAEILGVEMKDIQLEIQRWNTLSFK